MQPRSHTARPAAFHLETIFPDAGQDRTESWPNSIPSRFPTGVQFVHHFAMWVPDQVTAVVVIFAVGFLKSDLSGVGNRVDRAWTQVIEHVKSE